MLDRWLPLALTAAWALCLTLVTLGLLEDRSAIGLLHATERWDVGWYQHIVAHWYAPLDRPDGQQPAVFFPLLPLLARLVHVGTGASPLVSLNVVQKLSLVPLAYLSWRWVAELCPESGLQGRVAGLLSLLLHPTFVFLLVPYTESLYLCLLFAALLAWAPRRPGLLFAAAFLLGVTRPTGLFLGPTALLWLAVESARHRSWRFWRSVETRDRACVVALVLAPVAAFATVAFIDQLALGDALAFLHYRGKWMPRPALTNLLAMFRPDPQFGPAWVALGGSVLLFRRGLRFEALLCVVSLLLPLYQGNFGDMVRYTFGAAPAWMLVWIALGRWRWALVAIAIGSTALGLQLLTFWLAGRWVG